MLRMLVRIIKDWERDDDLFRQTPGNTGEWGDVRFIMEEEASDIVVFTNRVKTDTQLRCNSGGRWSIQMEPPTPAHRWMRRSDHFFDRIFTQDIKAHQSKRLLTHGALPWHINRNYDELSRLEPGAKNELVSFVTSSADWMNGHELRNYIARNMNGQGLFDLYGRGYNPIPDKFDALYPYQYSLVIENSFYPHYWTEKLADSLLSWTVPIYIGAPNVDTYFPEKAIIKVQPEPETIRDTLSAIKDDDWHERLEAVQKARDLLLNHYQLFPFLVRQIHERREVAQGKVKNFQFPANPAPWEGGKLGIGRRIEYHWRKFKHQKPY